jgi:phosphohistidine phosphatase
MKTIYLMRHAKAEPGGSGSDHDRELTDDGRRQARRMGAFLRATDQIPDRIVTSTAVRARTTARALSEDGGWASEVPMRQASALYDGKVDDVLQEIQATRDGADSVLVVGHQPTWALAIGRLTGGSSVAFPTGACARIDVDADRWAKVREDTGRLAWLLPPALLT